MSNKVEVPDLKVGALREYVGALRSGVQALRYREAALLERFEIVAFRDARDARRELEELVELAEREL